MTLGSLLVDPSLSHIIFLEYLQKIIIVCCYLGTYLEFDALSDLIQSAGESDAENIASKASLLYSCTDLFYDYPIFQ